MLCPINLFEHIFQYIITYFIEEKQYRNQSQIQMC